jgi:hypothetical protein
VSSSPTTQQMPPAQRAPATGKLHPPQGSLRAWQRGQAPPLPHPRRGPTSTHSWPTPASSKPSWRRSIERCGCSAPLWRGKPLHAASAYGSWACRPATASTPISTSTTQTRLREQAKSSSPPRRCCGPCPPLQRPKREPAPRGAGAHRASGRPAGRELSVPHPPVGGRAGRWGHAGGRTLGARRRSDGAPRQPGTHAGQRTSPRHTRASTGRRHPQRHQRSANEQSGCASGGRLPPSAGWTLRQ